MARAVVEAVAFSMGDAAESFGNTFKPPSPIPAIGGGSRSDAVLQALADVLNHPVARAEAGEGGAALGAAMLAEVGQELRSVERLSFVPPLSRTVEPTANTGLLERFWRYKALYMALRAAIQAPKAAGQSQEWRSGGEQAAATCLSLRPRRDVVSGTGKP